jgi:transposase-like protein
MGTEDSDRVVTWKDGRKKRFHSKQKRRQIVEETLKPGASVSRVARAHDVNANQVFKWRKQYREGRLDLDPSPSRLLPVKVSDPVATVRAESTASSRPRLGTRRAESLISIWVTRESGLKAAPIQTACALLWKD